MQQTVERRRSRFLKALAAAGMTQSGWARERGISKAHLSYVLNGHRESDTLAGKIDAFTREHLSKPAALVG